jgi:hypothetical protein
MQVYFPRVFRVFERNISLVRETAPKTKKKQVATACHKRGKPVTTMTMTGDRGVNPRTVIRWIV